MTYRVWVLFCVSLVCVGWNGNSASGQDAPERPGTWEPVDSPVFVSLRGAWAVDDDVLWASGAKGSVLRSIDGGASWRAIEVTGHAETDFRDIHAWDSRNALIMAAGAPPVLLRTEDGGEHWREVLRHADPGAFFDAIAFRNENEGWAVADPIDGRLEIFATNDGGWHWEALPAEQRPECDAAEHLYAASGTALEPLGTHDWLIGLGGAPEAGNRVEARLLHFHGESGEWRSRDVPLGTSESAGIFSVVTWGTSGVAVVGGDYQEPEGTMGIAAFSADSGVRWQSPQASPRGYRSCVRSLEWQGKPFLVSCGPNGVDASANGGETWWPLSTTGYHALSFSPSGMAGVAVGSDGRVARWVPRDATKE